MRVGTKSVILGVHSILIHPFFVAWAWWRLYGFPWDGRFWLAFFLQAGAIARAEDRLSRADDDLAQAVQSSPDNSEALASAHEEVESFGRIAQESPLLAALRFPVSIRDLSPHHDCPVG